MRRAFFLLALAALTGPAAGAEKEAPKTVIKGARMEVLQKGEVTEFRGGVTLTRGSDFMSADRMVSREKEGVTRAWGNVYLRRRDPERGVLWEAWSDDGVYDTNLSSGTLWGNVFMEVAESTPSTRVTRVWADRVERDPLAGSLRFTGAHAGRGKRGTKLMPPWPDGARPRPRVFQKAEDGESRELAGETVVYYEDGGRLIAQGDVRTAWKKGGGVGPAR
jgi:lipopolysaccharide export system protein LptA